MPFLQFPGPGAEIDKRTSRRCWVSGCIHSRVKNARKTKLCVFPRDVNRCRLWLEAVGDPTLARTPWPRLTKYRFICKDHFLPRLISPTGRVYHGAVPTLFAGNRPVLDQDSLEEFEANVPERRRYSLPSRNKDHEYCSRTIQYIPGHSSLTLDNDPKFNSNGEKEAETAEQERLAEAVSASDFSKIFPDCYGQILLPSNQKNQYHPRTIQHLQANSSLTVDNDPEFNNNGEEEADTAEQEDLAEVESASDNSKIFPDCFGEEEAETAEQEELAEAGSASNISKVSPDCYVDATTVVVTTASSTAGPPSPGPPSPGPPSPGPPSPEFLCVDDTPNHHSVDSSSIVPSNNFLKDPLVEGSNLIIPPYTETDPTFLDHDYICTSVSKQREIPVSGQRQIQESPNKTKNISLRQRALEDVKKELCRLCGLKGSHLMPIFGKPSNNSKEVPLSVKIEMYFPFKVKDDDPLPTHICLKCYDVLNKWHKMQVASVVADVVLWKTFGSKNSPGSELKGTTSSAPMDIRNSRAVPEEGTPLLRVKNQVQDVAKVDPPFGAAIIVKVVVPQASTKAKEDLCSKCEKNKTVEIQKEKGPFGKDLDKSKFGENKAVETHKEKDPFIVELDNSIRKFHPFRSKCHFCYEFFSKPCDRRNHVAMCRQLSTVCDVCGHKISCRKDLSDHKYRKHVSKLVCDKCDNNFKNLRQLKSHKKVFHEEGNSSEYYCKLCCTVFLDEYIYDYHMKRHEKGYIKTLCPVESFMSEHSENPTEYTCPVCQQIFSNISLFVVHLTTKKKVKCSTCQKVVNNEKQLILHECTKWTCQYCSKTFANKVNLRLHERIHTGEKPLKCRSCDETFHSWSTLRTHQNSHEPLLQCSYCGKRMRNKYYLQDHMSKHEGKVLSCNICNKIFSTRGTLWRHNNKFHKNTTKSS